MLIIDPVKKDLDQESNNNKAHTSITTKMQSINAILDKIEMNTDNNHPLEQEDDESELEVDLESRMAEAIRGMVRIGKGKYVIRRP